MKIGVFDSGVGGKSFVNAVQKRFPQADVTYKEDRTNVPYGDKTPQELLQLTTPIFQSFVDEGCKAVLVACNTLTTNVIEDLRNAVDIPLVGVEPMIKPAAEMTQTGSIAVCATPGTLRSKRYAELKSVFGQNLDIIEPDCSKWAYMIEHSQLQKKQLKEMVNTLRIQKVDVIVLGCTHYHWIEEEIRKLAKPDMQVIQPMEPVLDQIERVMS